jgi:HlyD family secretion protein
MSIGRLHWLRSKSFLAIAAVVAALLAVALWPRRIAVEAASVTRGPLAVTLDEEGRTRVRQRYGVTSPVSGRLLRIALEPGDPVRRSETVVARLLPADSPPLDARSRAESSRAVEAARAALERAGAEANRAMVASTQAAADLERTRRLVAGGAATRQALESAESGALTADATRRAALFAADAASHELEVTRARLASPRAATGRPIEILSPVDGVVLRRLRESEATVPAGELLLELGDPASLEIVADYLSSDAVRIAAGQPVHIEQWGGAAALTGKVRRVEPAGFTKVSALGVEEQRVNVVIDFDLPRAAAQGLANLGDAFRVETRVVVWSAADVLRIPMSGLFRADSSTPPSGEAWSTFELVNGRAHARSVLLGARNDLEAQLLRGLEEGATVVLHPPDTLKDGGRVRIARDPG